jgi:ParB-like chromosome segregation protein Spo0J
MNSTICSPRQSWRDVLKIHPAADEYPSMGDDELAALAVDIYARGLQQHIILFRDADGNDLLLDGRHRLDAIELAGFTLVAGGKFDRSLGLGAGCRVRVVAGVDPFELAASLNAHRRHLKPEEKRARIEALLRAHPEKSDRSIAEAVGSSPTTVGARRAELASTVQSGQLSEPETKRVGADGRARALPKKSKTTKAERNPNAAWPRARRCASGIVSKSRSRRRRPRPRPSV